MICLSLEPVLTDTFRLLENNSSTEKDTYTISTSLAILKDAESELSCMLRPRIHLTVKLEELKKTIDEKITNYHEEINDAAKKKDFIQLTLSQQKISDFSCIMEKYLTESNKTKIKRAKSICKREVASIPEYIDNFFMSSFKDGDELFRSMSNLKQAADDPLLTDLIEIYEKSKSDISERAHTVMNDVRKSVSDVQCFDHVIPYIHALNRQLQSSLKSHCNSDLLEECNNLVDCIREEKKEYDKSFLKDGEDIKANIDKWAKKLDYLQSSRWYHTSWKWTNKIDVYNDFCQKLCRKCEETFSKARDALRNRDLCSVRDGIEILMLITSKAKNHVKVAETRVRDLKELCISAFLNLCNRSKEILESTNSIQFEEIFPDYRSFLIYTPCILNTSEGRRCFDLVNQSVFKLLDDEVETLQKIFNAEELEFSSLRSNIIRVRVLGNFFADHYTLLIEEISCCEHSQNDKWLIKIHDLCWKNFGNGRDLSKIKQCAILGVVPSASKEDIEKAFKKKALKFHPDKIGKVDGDKGEMFRKLHEAREILLNSSHISQPNSAQPFDETLTMLGSRLRILAKSFMKEQRYEMMEKLLFQLPNLKMLEDLVIPNLDCHEIEASVNEITKCHVKKIRLEVDSNWAARCYNDLNENISDLKLMERYLKAYPHIFSTSWNTGIIEQIETEIEALGQKLRGFLRDNMMAKQKECDFRRCFIQMGSVLVELPSFKSVTKGVMYNVLEACLESYWGYSYLFELGLSLQRGDESFSENENKVAKQLVSEFSHFKEVMTMVWNQETSQKPAEDTVMYIKGERRISSSSSKMLNIDKNTLLEYFFSYEKEYKVFLGEYIRPEADLKSLIKKTKDVAESIKPLRCDSGWGEEVKRKIPSILAGVFTIFTVLKSGASYNRIEASGSSSQIGEKLLMKPHNIQVLTLLYMLGCGDISQSLESQLMQIRTGEGKSMILGAAATVLGLLGFRVRTVCYSEYLSNRDFKLFEQVFERFELIKFIKYSKITTYAEDSAASKGDIRRLTKSLLYGRISQESSAESYCFFQNEFEEGHISSPKAKNLSKIADSLDYNHQPIDSENFSSRTSLKEHTSKKVEGPNDNDTTFITTYDDSKEDRKSSKLDSIDRIQSGMFQNKSIHTFSDLREEILLVDEVDVFFGPDFYGKTYNKVVEINEPEIAIILKRIWFEHIQGKHHLKLDDIKSMREYASLLKKLHSFSYLLDKEISLMLDQVKKVDDNPYHIDTYNDRIGYKVMDTISYGVTYGYATIFAYLKESSKFKNKNVIEKKLVMAVSCGQFSYANISPKRILGVSGTLQAMGDYEKDVLNKYGLNKFIYVPSVYGESNFLFDKAGKGIYIENNQSNFFHRIVTEITEVTKSKRAVIVFFRDSSKLNEFLASPIYRQPGRQKKHLTEDLDHYDKEYVISKAATSGQITLCTAVFGRGTDFFCQDEVVQKQGGVHIIQTFLSKEISEEVQIQGRTARQGKQGSYQIVLLNTDLESEFRIPPGERNKIEKEHVYEWLCNVRNRCNTSKCKKIDKNLADAVEKDKMTRKYFNSLLSSDEERARDDFEKLYLSIKKPPFPSSLGLDLAFVIDVTGSMKKYSLFVDSTIQSILQGKNSLVSRLKQQFPEIHFKLRVGCLAFRDIDDKNRQFSDNVLKGGSYFTCNTHSAINFIKSELSNASGGFDLAEDHFGAIHYSAKYWDDKSDWNSEIRCMFLVSDAPAHGMVPQNPNGLAVSDNYPSDNSKTTTANTAVDSLIKKGINLFFCSLNRVATSRTEGELSKLYKNHPDNNFGGNITTLSLFPTKNDFGHDAKHIIFVLDESGSMRHSWEGVVVAYQKYLDRRIESQCDSDLVSIVQFGGDSRITIRLKLIRDAPKKLSFGDGGTQFYPAALDAWQLARDTPSSHEPAVIFMSDGVANDSTEAAEEFSSLNDLVSGKSGKDLELHVIAFGTGTNDVQLNKIASSSKNGKVYSSSNTSQLAMIFENIATNQNITISIESEISKRISEAVSDKISLEYFGN